MDQHPIVDVHSHPGRSFLAGAEPDSLVIRMMRDGFEPDRVADMREAQVTAGLLMRSDDRAHRTRRNGECLRGRFFSFSPEVFQAGCRP